MSYTPPTEREVELMRARTKLHEWEQLADFGFTASTRAWAAKKADQYREQIATLEQPMNGRTES